MTEPLFPSNAPLTGGFPGFAPVPETFPAYHKETQRSAIKAWRDLLGSERVVCDEEMTRVHGKNAIGSPLRARVILKPNHADQISHLVRIAEQFRVPLNPVSVGRNWGYGAASPMIDQCAVVDLSSLQEIKIVDADLGIVSLQPGVTQGMLYEFLRKEELPLMVPVHGGGPTCSLLGNALERGYGLTPACDHFAALTSLKAILPDGSQYQSPFHALGAELIGSAHRWGIGPYLEGLFSQGNFGIVTEGTFTLQRRPEHVEAFFISITDQRQLALVIPKLRELLQSLGGNIVGVNLMNDRRVLAMSREYPLDRVEKEQIISDTLCNEMTSQAGISAWTIAGVLHCPLSMRRAIRHQITKTILGSASRPIFLNRRRIQWALRASRLMPNSRSAFVQGQLESITSLLNLAEGIPSKVALPLAYWLRGTKPNKEQELNPSQDDCGLIWYSPLVPAKSKTIIQFTTMVNRVCHEHCIEPLITLTSLSERLLDSTVPILYRPEEPGAIDRAHRCYQALVDEGRKLGCLPYRLNTQSMQQLDFPGSESHWDLVRKFKKLIDPSNLISPGRYCPM